MGRGRRCISTSVSRSPPPKADRMANACETGAEQLVVWALLDTGLRVGELCGLIFTNVHIQEEFERKW